MIEHIKNLVFIFFALDYSFNCEKFLYIFGEII